MILPLDFRAQHLFIEIDGQAWLLDTGSPSSFSERSELNLADRSFAVGRSYFGLDAQQLSEMVGEHCIGLIGSDVLQAFDCLIDLPRRQMQLSVEPMQLAGRSVAIELFMGIPTIEVDVEGRSCRMFFDTGAQISYWQDEDLCRFPPTGTLSDFYPGWGSFQTETFAVPMRLADKDFTVRCGRLPGLLGQSLLLAGTQGILGNAILCDRALLYAPRRGQIVLEA